ncbi:hypothetical protein N7486_009448 [Penicillium sp. IBT 16267x]|nr:hypothetical protein N7486_009382 [Penicillium sp. IBT 16267x]KAJ6088151.1 hypothetical protein N7486_009412 [Penicillium sp. IBT 16267x]KAJ6088157.1 hypothetical protein N7486_009418 [Penicillium sp. IBT 16267x]KAJ6088175.1 hypothetical protein N7486_009436 [Penicillium sp. IBT 16267x]KAJ6088181.1 hypothetical protein N7486_009442 [Penicillium sp. IBT 16267x]
MPPGSPRGLPPPLRANWSTRLLRDAQRPIADWSIAPAAPNTRRRRLVNSPCCAQHPSSPTGQFPLLRPTPVVADWSIPPALLHLPPPPVCWLRSPPPAPRPPPKATQPTGSPSPPCRRSPRRGAPVGTTVQPAGCLAWAIPPGRGPRPPPRG